MNTEEQKATLLNEKIEAINKAILDHSLIATKYLNIINPKKQARIFRKQLSKKYKINQALLARVQLIINRNLLSIELLKIISQPFPRFQKGASEIINQDENNSEIIIGQNGETFRIPGTSSTDLITDTKNNVPDRQFPDL